MRLILIFFVCFFQVVRITAQEEKEYLLRSILFYNVENLFDTINNPLTFDDDRTPTGKYKWSSEKYFGKLDRIAEVISKFKINDKPIMPDLIGLCEVENDRVLKDLVSHPRLRSFSFGIIHEDSPDERGIDVALLYRKSTFIPDSFQSHRLLLFDEELNREYTRDQLVVSGLLDNEEILIIINHWPSRRGGAIKTSRYREAAAKLSKNIIDSIQRLRSDLRIIVMGDFNDNPNDVSINRILIGKSEVKKHNKIQLFNPMSDLYRKGLGTVAYQDKWSLFDQIIISENLKSQEEQGFRLWRAGIYFDETLITPRGRYKGYPYRTYSGTQYTGGYSDHFPVYLLLIREITNK